MHKEAPLTKQQKEELRSKNMRERDAYESKNLGGFRKSFPNDDPVNTSIFYVFSRYNKNMKQSLTLPSTFGTTKMALDQLKYKHSPFFKALGEEV